MTSGFLRLYDPERGSFPAFAKNGEVFDISEIVRSGIDGLIQGRQLNAPEFHDEELRSRLTPRLKYHHNYDFLWRQLSQDSGPHLMLPFDPPEVWGVGVSYQKTAELHDEDLRATGCASGLYAYVFKSERPEIFFKGTGRHCVGHNDFFTIRGDSRGTTIEAELACIYDSEGSIVGYTIANDVTAWDIEKECPLFLSYAKIFSGSCVLGPTIVPAHLVADPLSLSVRCCVERLGRRIYEGEGNTRNMKRSLSEMTRYLTYCNPVPDGTVLTTGTAVGVPNDLVIEDGDCVSIAIEQLGELRATARRWPGKP